MTSSYTTNALSQIHTYNISNLTYPAYNYSQVTSTLGSGYYNDIKLVNANGLVSVKRSSTRELVWQKFPCGWNFLNGSYTVSKTYTGKTTTTSTTDIANYTGTQHCNPSHGSRRVVLRTGTAKGDVVRYGLTTNPNAKEYCGLRMNIDGQVAYIGRYDEVTSSYGKSSYNIITKSISTATMTSTVSLSTMYYSYIGSYASITNTYDRYTNTWSVDSESYSVEYPSYLYSYTTTYWTDSWYTSVSTRPNFQQGFSTEWYSSERSVGTVSRTYSGGWYKTMTSYLMGRYTGYGSEWCVVARENYDTDYNRTVNKYRHAVTSYVTRTALGSKTFSEYYATTYQTASTTSSKNLSYSGSGTYVSASNYVSADGYDRGEFKTSSFSGHMNFHARPTRVSSSYTLNYSSTSTGFMDGCSYSMSITPYVSSLTNSYVASDTKTSSGSETYVLTTSSRASKTSTNGANLLVYDYGTNYTKYYQGSYVTFSGDITSAFQVYATNRIIQTWDTQFRGYTCYAPDGQFALTTQQTMSSLHSQTFNAKTTRMTTILRGMVASTTFPDENYSYKSTTSTTFTTSKMSSTLSKNGFCVGVGFGRCSFTHNRYTNSFRASTQTTYYYDERVTSWVNSTSSKTTYYYGESMLCSWGKVTTLTQTLKDITSSYKVSTYTNKTTFSTSKHSTSSVYSSDARNTTTACGVATRLTTCWQRMATTTSSYAPYEGTWSGTSNVITTTQRDYKYSSSSYYTNTALLSCAGTITTQYTSTGSSSYVTSSSNGLTLYVSHRSFTYWDSSVSPRNYSTTTNQIICKETSRSSYTGEQAIVSTSRNTTYTRECVSSNGILFTVTNTEGFVSGGDFVGFVETESANYSNGIVTYSVGGMGKYSISVNSTSLSNFTRYATYTRNISGTYGDVVYPETGHNGIIVSSTCHTTYYSSSVNIATSYTMSNTMYNHGTYMRTWGMDPNNVTLEYYHTTSNYTTFSGNMVGQYRGSIYYNGYSQTNSFTANYTSSTTQSNSYRTISDRTIICVTTVLGDYVHYQTSTPKITTISSVFSTLRTSTVKRSSYLSSSSKSTSRSGSKGTNVSTTSNNDRYYSSNGRYYYYSNIRGSTTSSYVITASTSSRLWSNSTMKYLTTSATTSVSVTGANAMYFSGTELYNTYTPRYILTSSSDASYGKNIGVQYLSRASYILLTNEMSTAHIATFDYHSSNPNTSYYSSYSTIKQQSNVLQGFVHTNTSSFISSTTSASTWMTKYFGSLVQVAPMNKTSPISISYTSTTNGRSATYMVQENAASQDIALSYTQATLSSSFIQYNTTSTTIQQSLTTHNFDI